MRVDEHAMTQTESGEIICDARRTMKLKFVKSDSESDQKTGFDYCSDSIHSAIATKMFELIMLFDNYNMYILDMKKAQRYQDRAFEIDEKDIIIHRSINCQGLQLLEDKYLYMMNAHGHSAFRDVDPSSMSPKQLALVNKIAIPSGLGFVDLTTLLD